VPEGCSIETLSIDPRAGGKYAIAIHSPKGLVTVHGEYLEILKPQRLVFTMKWDEDEDLTHVTLEFFQRGSATELVLTHDRLDRPELREGLADGWNSVFENLGRLLA
jgi:uncharacterized protein YndB with AHSA1/START domain